jgi:hypothetical protein
VPTGVRRAFGPSAFFCRAKSIRPAATVAACLLGGCNQPAVTLKAPAFQSSENTIRDWNDVAHRIASQMTSLGLLPSPWQPAPADAAPPKPVFVKVLAQDSAFARMVASKLEADVLRTGGTVARSPYGATVVNLDVEFVRWTSGNHSGDSGDTGHRQRGIGTDVDVDRGGYRQLRGVG